MITSCWPERLSFEASCSSSSSIMSPQSLYCQGVQTPPPWSAPPMTVSLSSASSARFWQAFPRPARGVRPGEVEVRPVVVRLMGVLNAGLVAASSCLSGVRVLWERGLVMRARGASCSAPGWWFSVGSEGRNGLLNGSFGLLCDSCAPLNGGGKAWGRDDWRDRDIAITSSVIHCDSLTHWNECGLFVCTNIETNMQLIYSKQNLEFIVFIVMQKIIYDENSQAENWIMHNIHYWSNVALVKKIMFFERSAHQSCIYLIKKYSKTVIMWNNITIQNKCSLFQYILKCNLFIWCKAEFSASLLQSSVSHDPSAIILICWFAAQLLLLSSVLN